MIKNIVILCSVILGLTLTGCAIQRAHVASNAKRTMIGMSKQQVLQCMGTATATQNAYNTEVWKYLSGGETVETMEVKTDDKASHATVNTTHLSCEINLVFTNGIVTKVLYSGNTGRLFSHNEQCSYAVSNCVH